MNRYDPDRPSIFTKPDAESTPAATTPETIRASGPPAYGEDPTVVTPAWRPPRPPRRPPLRDASERPDARGEPISRQVIVLGSMGIAILALGGFIAASVLGPANPGLVVASAEPSNSVASVASADPNLEPTAPPDATFEPTPQPTPAGPPQEVALGGWATVTVEELNVRTAPGLDETSVYRLVKGAVVHVPEGPTVVDGGNWYRVASLGGASGWASSGSIAEPYLQTLVNDPTLIRCGKVMRPVFEIVSGAPQPRDPLLIGSMALPVAAFSDLSLGALELIRGMDQEACFSAEVDANGNPTIGSELNVGACGHSEADGGFFRLRPSAGGTTPLSNQVKDPVVLHPSILSGGPPDDRKSSNIRSIVSMMANEGVTGCIYASVVDGRAGVSASRSVDVAQCSIVHEYNADSLKLSPASGGDMAWIKLTADAYQPGQFPLETPVSVSVNAYAEDKGRAAYAWLGGDQGCS